MFTLICESQPNPDFGQRFKPFREAIRVPTLKDASREARQWIGAYDLGAGNWCGDAGRVLDADGRDVARVSYNGRVWEPGSYPTPEITI